MNKVIITAKSGKTNTNRMREKSISMYHSRSVGGEGLSRNCSFLWGGGGYRFRTKTLDSCQQAKVNYA